MIKILSLLHACLDTLVKSIFDVVVCAARQVFGNFSPLRAHLHIELGHLDIFLKCPLVALNVWIELVKPALAALLGDATWNHRSDQAPVLLSVLLHKVGQDLILFGCPSLLSFVGLLSELKVARVALDHGLLHVLADDAPLTDPVSSDQRDELFVL